jgi:hypothetical protein
MAPSNEDTIPVTIRISPDIYERIGKFREKMRDRFPGSKPSTSDAVRALLERGLQETVPR